MNKLKSRTPVPQKPPKVQVPKTVYNRKHHPLQQAYDKIDLIDQEIRGAFSDEFYGVATSEAVQEKMTELNILKEIADSELEKVRAFLTYAADVASGKIINFNGDNCYAYFNRELKPWEFQYAQRGVLCDFCNRSRTRNTGIVYTYDPCDNKLVYICDMCFIEKKRDC